MPDLSIVVPCFNEAQNIPELVSAFEDALQTIDVEVIIVDNGSTDDTQEVLTRVIQAQSIFKIVTLPVNHGYGNGILQGLAVSSGSVLGWTHADLQTDPADICKGYKLFVSKSVPCFVKGARIRDNRSVIDLLLTRGMQIAAMIILRSNIEDINAQPKIFSREFYEQHVFGKAPLDFSLDLFILVASRKAGLAQFSFPVTFAERKAGDAKGGGANMRTRLKIILRTLSYMRDLQKKI